MRHALSLFMAFAVCACSQDQVPPNIILIVVDDLGYSDLSCYGNELVETPNIDRMAAEGIQFTSAYASCTVCSPTRAALMTGKNPVSVNITDWIPGRQDARGGPTPEEMFVVPRFNQQLPLQEITLAEKLKEAGYTCASIGKWHLGGEGFLPTDQGFDVNIAGYSKGSPPSYYYPYTRQSRMDTIKPLELRGDSLYLTDRLTDEAIGFITQGRDHPFFLYLPFYNVHTPLEGRYDLLKKYENILADDRGDSILRNPHFLAMTEAVDENVGRIMDFLEKQELDTNTLVIFTSDNGGLLLRRDNFIRASWNYPLREGKGTLYEGGLRIPAIAWWPGKIQSGRISNELIISTDIFPTLTELAGLPAEHELEGKSLLPHLLNCEGLDRETLFWHYPHYHLGMPGAVIRDGDYKLIEYFETGVLELYNLRTDPRELNNLAAEFSEKAEQMRNKLLKWQRENGAKMPTLNPSYQTDK
jgi:arylsulfatase A-like enzyme